MSDQVDSEVIQQLERISKAIRTLEGMRVPYDLARKLSNVLADIADYCAPEVKNG